MGYIVTHEKDPGLFIIGLPWKTLSLTRLDFKLLWQALVSGEEMHSEKVEQLQTHNSHTMTQRNAVPLVRLIAQMKGNDGVFERTWSAYLRYLPPPTLQGKYLL